MKRADDKDLEVRMEFKEDKLTVTQKGVTLTDEKLGGTYRINSEKSPATMDFTVEVKTSPGIYELKGDELRICFPFVFEGSRPNAFEVTEKSVLITLKRQKP